VARVGRAHSIAKMRSI